MWCFFLWQKGKTCDEWVTLMDCLVEEKHRAFLFTKKRDCVVWWLGFEHIVSLPNSEQNFVVLWLMPNRWSKRLKLAQDERTEGSVYSVAPLCQSCSVLVRTLPAGDASAGGKKKKRTLANSFLSLLLWNAVQMVFGISLIANIQF